MSGALAGVQLGPYRLESLIGAGGMGEVYRGTDTRLARQVAIKILPAAWAADPERRASSAITGRPPFEGSGSPALMAAILRSDPAPIETVRPAVPAALAWLIRICLAKSPDDRFASMHDVLLHLRRIAAEPESAQGQGPRRQRGRRDLGHAKR